MEKYGEVPKRFTKAWWEHFWYYYKWHTLGVAFVALMIAISCTECAMRDKYDVTITYAGEMMFMPQTVEKIRDELSKHIEDVDGNEKVLADFVAFNIAKNGTSQAGTEYNSAMMTKLTMEFQTGDSYIFLLNRQELDKLLNSSAGANVFMPLSDWVSCDIGEAKTAKKSGVDYAVDITGNKFFSETLGLNMGDSLYIAMRGMRSRDAEDERQQKNLEQSMILGNHILENN